MSTVVLPGSFDPFTLGHWDLAQRAASIADRVIIAVSHNPSKRHTLSHQARIEAIEATISGSDIAERFTVQALDTPLLVDFCTQVGATAVVRGLRSQVDLAYEEPMARMNQHLAEIDTIFLLTDSRYAHISSSLVREVHSLGGDVSDMLPPASLEALAQSRRS